MSTFLAGNVNFVSFSGKCQFRLFKREMSPWSHLGPFCLHREISSKNEKKIKTLLTPLTPHPIDNDGRIRSSNMGKSFFPLPLIPEQHSHGRYLEKE